MIKDELFIARGVKHDAPGYIEKIFDIQINEIEVDKSRFDIFGLFDYYKYLKVILSESNLAS